jgi:hypothetical protein
MPYAVRDTQGRITSLHRHDPGVGEELPGRHPEVLDFLGLAGTPAAEAGFSRDAGGYDADSEGAHEAGFNRLDADFIRVLEDVIDALTSRNLINITDLPDIAQTKLFARKSFRERRPKNALDLFQAGDLDRLL